MPENYQRRPNYGQQTRNEQVQIQWTGGFIPTDEIEKKITDKTVIWANEFGKYLATPKEVKTTQIRRFFGEIKRIQMKGYEKVESDFRLLQPKLAYAVGRFKKESPKIQDFYNIIVDGINRVHSDEQFKNFIKVFEAIVAFHKQFVKE